MNGIGDFVSLVRDETGVPVTTETVGLSLDALPGWDSVHFIALLTALERETGRRIPMAGVLEASSLEAVYRLAVEA